MDIRELWLKANTYNKLEDLGIETVEEVQQLYEDGELERAVGKRAYKEIVEALNKI